jgi:hypothetical protein
MIRFLLRFLDMEQPEELPAFAPGLSREIRARIRADIEGRMVARAREEAAEARWTLRCRGGARLAEAGATGDQVRAEHARCMGEIAGAGCLCPCHDPDD